MGEKVVSANVYSLAAVAALLCSCALYKVAWASDLDKSRAAATVDVATIEHSLSSNGPAQTLRTFFDCSHPEGYRLITSGGPRAVALAATLLDTADGCDAIMLLSSLATAMQKNPEAVLPYMDTVEHGNVVRESFCIPFIGEGTSNADALAILKRSERSLRRVSRADLQKAKTTCLNEIDKYRRSLAPNPP